eukprot:scaffold12169_cov132-Cylindrotheca_fusiformis.AAC.7
MSGVQSKEFRSAYAGGCYKDGKPICVEEPKDFCDEGTFQTAHYLRANGGTPLRYCAYNIENVIIGRCGESGMCSNKASRCDDPSTFALDESCTTIRDKKKGLFTTYGKCDDRCSWSQDDCADDEVWTNNDDNCTADKVEVGACFSGYAFCTVDSANCIGATYLDYKEVRDSPHEVNCFLSELVPTNAPTISPAPTLRPVLPPTPIAQTPSLSPTVKPPDENNDILSTGAIVGITIGAVCLGLIISVASYYAGRGSRYRNNEDDEKQVAPVETINSGNFEVDVKEDLSI